MHQFPINNKLDVLLLWDGLTAVKAAWGGAFCRGMGG
jgi:hypothetical protein